MENVNKRVLVCDQGSKFGFSVFEINENYKLIKYGVIKLNNKLKYVERIISLEPILDSIINTCGINLLLMEDIQFQKNVDTYKKLSGLQFFLKYYCLTNGITCEEPVPVSTWRVQGVKNILNLPKGDKNTLHNHLQGVLNNPLSSSDMTDSIGMGLWFGNQLGYKEFILDQAEMVVIKDVSDKKKRRY